MPPVSSGLKKRVRAKLSILAKLQGVLATSRRERRPDEELAEDEIEVEVELRTPDVWAESFETLLSDFKGRNAFTEFLRKEYSDENINFWTACCNYAYIADESARKRRASEIYAKHLDEGATEPINIDSMARNQVKSDLEKAPSSIFDSAKNQVYALMKTDSYRRFLKSDMSKLPVEVAEMLPGQSETMTEGNTRHRDSAPNRVSPDQARAVSPEGDKTKYRQSITPMDGLSSPQTSSRTKLQGRPPCLGSQLDTKNLLANIQACSADVAVEKSAPCNGKTLQYIDIPEIVAPELVDIEKETIYLRSNNHQKLCRSKSDHDTCPPRHNVLGVRNTLPRGQQLYSTLPSPSCSLVNDRLSTSTPNNGEKSLIFGMFSSDSDSSDEETVNGRSKSFYLLRRLSHSLDHMIELEQAGIHSSDLDAIYELNDKMEHEALPSMEIERFLTTAESFTCHSTCSCGECQRLKEKEQIAARELADSAVHTQTIPAIKHTSMDDEALAPHELDNAPSNAVNGITDNVSFRLNDTPNMVADCAECDISDEGVTYSADNIYENDPGDTSHNNLTLLPDSGHFEL